MKPWQNKVVKEMQVLCEKLEEQNCEAFVAVVNSDGELITAGTDMAKNFMQREDLFLQRFGLAVSGKGALTGDRRMSYKKIAAGEVSVCGLPPGVSFNRPSSYGLEDLQAIVANSSKIYCEVMESVDAPIAEELQEDNPPQTSEPEEEMERVNAPIPEELLDDIPPETTVFRILQPIYQDLTS
ncbi:uncharacterized protein [Apostichopus japonicus]|uniref:uncharacterized protein isoform X2 n=1 Tax=Stichopus japonicus TaxID=307972 RepID=UPI003AB29522